MHIWKKGPKGQAIDAHVDDLGPGLATPPAKKRRPRGGGGGEATKPGEPGYMETWDVLEAPHPVHGKPLPDEGEDDWPTPEERAAKGRKLEGK